MDQDKSVAVKSFLGELEELSKKHNLWIEGYDMMLVNQDFSIVSDFLENEDNKKYIAF